MSATKDQENRWTALGPIAAYQEGKDTGRREALQQAKQAIDALEPTANGYVLKADAIEAIAEAERE